MLLLEDVKVNIRSVKILRQVSLEAESGQIVGLVGRNGAGKTTTIKSIVGLMPVASGSISFDGLNLLKIPAHQRAALGIGYLPEDRRMLAMTVEENLLLPAWASRLPNVKERLEFIYQSIPEVHELADRPAIQLSGGQQKIVAFARALMTGSKLLLLDEPFEGLSPGISQKFSLLIKRFQKQKLSFLVAESNLKRVENLVHKVYTIERGEITMTD